MRRNRALLTTAAIASILAAAALMTFYVHAHEDAALSQAEDTPLRPGPGEQPQPDLTPQAAATPLPQGGQRWRRHFPNVVLTTHQGKKVRFYDDLLKGKVVVINFMFTTCNGT